MKRILSAIFSLVIVSLSHAQSVKGGAEYLPSVMPVAKNVALKNNQLLSGSRTAEVGRHAEMLNRQPTLAGKPSGTEYPNWSRKGICYIMEAGKLTINHFDDGVMTTMVVNGDSVYLFNPVQAFPTLTWARGVQRGDTIIFATPQPIYEEEFNGMFYEYDLARLVDIEGENDYQVDEENREIRFLWKDGRIEQIDGGMIGIIDHSDNSWTKIGDRLSVLYRVTDTTVTPPSVAKAETYRMEYKDEESTSGKRIVKVIRHDNDIYIGSLWPSLENSWIKGTVSGDKATFDSWQYMGADTIRNFHSYAVAATGRLQKGVYYFTGASQIVFTLNSDDKSLKAEETLLINCGKSRVYYQQAYMHPVLTYYEERAATPQMPIVFSYSDYGSEETPDYGYVGFMLNPFDDQNYELLTEKLSYRLFMDDKVYEFRPEEYPGLAAPVTEIPYGFTNKNNIIAYGDQHEVAFKARGYKKMGVQAVYRGGNEVRMSEIAWQETTRIESVADRDEVESIVYYDLMGRRMTSLATGFYIRETKMKSGAVVRTKHYRK